MNNKKMYFDHNATTPIHEEVFDSMVPFLKEEWGNPSSIHWAGRAPKKAVDEARQQVCSLINCTPLELVFTGSGSEGINLAIKGIALAKKSKGNHIITTKVEHPAVINTCKYLVREGFEVTYLEQLFVKLRKGGLVKSVRGPGGGYVLTRTAAEISVCDVIEVVEEPLNPVSCLDDVPTDCEKFNRCATKKVWQGLGNRIKEFLSSVSIEELSIDAHSFDEDSGSGKTNKEDSVCTHPPS